MAAKVPTLAMAAALMFGLAPPASPQTQRLPDKSDWANVRSLQAGVEIRVKITDGKPVRGRVGGVTDESLSVGNETVARSSVADVAVKSKSHRKRNILIGLAAGAAGGLAIGAVGDSRTCNKTPPPGTFIGCIDPVGPNFLKEVLTPVGAILGAGAGAIFPTGGWREIYRTR